MRIASADGSGPSANRVANDSPSMSSIAMNGWLFHSPSSIHLADERVGYASRDASLANQPHAGVRIARVLPQHFEGDLASQAFVFRDIHDAHAALTELVQHPVVGDLSRCRNLPKGVDDAVRSLRARRLRFVL